MFIFFQKIIPKNLLSRSLAYLAHWRCNAFKKWAIKCFNSCYSVNMAESLVRDINEFACFNDFFIRRLKPGARKFPKDDSVIVSPADGVISEIGHIQTDSLLQAKGHYYTLDELLNGDKQMAQYFNNGEYLCIYLAPKDYHRVHMPMLGVLRQMCHVPGKLFSVNAISVRSITKLFARNERVVCLFATPEGPMAVILVGACLIGSVATSWHGIVMPKKEKQAVNITYEDSKVTLPRGEELGYFQWGSTVIVLFGENCVRWHQDLNPGDPILMGQAIGESKSGPTNEKRERSLLLHI